MLLSSLGLANPLDCGFDRLAGDPAVAAQFGKVIDRIDHFESSRPVSTSSERLKNELPERLIPFFESGFQGYFEGAGGVPIYYRKWAVPNPKGVVVLVHGMGQSHARYVENVYNFAENGYSVFIADQRGHGKSGRELPPGKDAVHVEDFGDYVSDLKKFLETVVQQDYPGPVNLVGKSMGGMVALRLTEEQPDLVNKVVLLAPMLKMRTKGLPEMVAQVIAKGAVALGKGEDYALGQKPHPEHGPAREKHYPDRSAETRSKTLAEFERNTLAPEERTGGATFGWVNASLKGSRLGRAKAPSINHRVLLFSAGDDRTVISNVHEDFCRDVPGCRLIQIPEASHTLFQQGDGTRDIIFREIFSFLPEEETPNEP